MTDERTPEQVQQDNLAHFMEHGSGLSYGYGIFVLARDRAKGRVFMGGLGGMGVGRMWNDVDPTFHPTLPGWDDAPEAPSPRGPFHD